jgi:pyrimidine-nucleoside phosphorylase
MTFYEIVTRKKRGEELTAEEIDFLVDGFLAGRVADYQMSAFLMAVWFTGMSPLETAQLTRAMIRSGATFDLSTVPGPKIDKHSTGGVGDKVTLVLAPLVASCGVRVPMVSGRGLGHTGGTLDKLESIPGYRTRLDRSEFLELLARVGLVVMGQTGDLAPADGKLYALRDVTGTVDSRPLIVASILSKKVAAGPEAIVMDVKVGSGAFMTSRSEAEELGRLLVGTGRELGRRVEVVFTNMDRPLGRAVGNALEVREAVACLRGEGPGDVMEVTLALAERMLLLGGRARDAADARDQLGRSLEGGGALRTFEAWVSAQGGSIDLESADLGLPTAPFATEWTAPTGGTLRSVDTWKLGMAAIGLGAGRVLVTDRVDPGAGFELLRTTGAEVEEGEAILRVHARGREEVEAIEPDLAEVFEIGAGPPRGLAGSPAVLGLLGGDGRAEWWD